MKADVAAFLLVAGLLATPVIQAHDAHRTEGMDDQLLDAGQGLMVGSFDAPQEGPLVVVPYVEGPIDCNEPAGYVLPVGGGAGVSFAVNETHLVASVQVPANATGYVGVGVDSANAWRTIMMMLEHAIAMHYLGAHVIQDGPNGTRSEFRSGLMGVPYLFPGAENASVSSPYFIDVPMPGDGVRMIYDAKAPVRPCPDTRPGHRTVMVDRWTDPESLDAAPRWRDSLGPGSIVHAMVHFDPEVPYALPRPVETTHELQVNLYLTRASEEADRVQAALETRPDATRIVPVAGVAVGLLWIGQRRP